MSGIFSVLGDSQTGLYRLKQASRYADPLDGPKTVQEQLADKQRGAALPFSLAPRDQRNANAAMSAMEEAKRIASPKAHAEQRLAEVERRLEELRAEMRLAAAQGDREKVMELAREAAQLAREAGRAAKAYARGLSAAAAMGKGATEAGTVETVRERSTTTLTIASVETSVELRIGSGASGEPAGGAPTAPSATTPSATVPSAEDGMQELLGAALDYVRQRLALSPTADEEEEETRENLTIKAYASYVLALTGEAPLGWMAHIRENSSLLRSSGAIFLAGAYALASNNSGPLEDLGSALPSLRAGDGDRKSVV